MEVARPVKYISPRQFVSAHPAAHLKRPGKVLHPHGQSKLNTLMSGSDRCRRKQAGIFCSCGPVGLTFTPSRTSRLQFGSMIRGPRQMGQNSKAGGLVMTRCGGGSSRSFGSEDEENSFYMKRALTLAKEAFGFTSPNPMVGCVLVKDGQIIGEGFHPKAGQPHAEVFALRNAREPAEGATAYVTLEPCNHFGRTPPCTEALVKAKVKKVVVGMVDPNPIVAFKGVERLKQEGIKVVVGVEEALCRKLLESYTHRMLTGKPYLTLRYSISVNGVPVDELGDAATETGGYYSQLLQEYDAVIHSAASLSKVSELPSSKETKANQPLHVVVADNPSSGGPISISPDLLRDHRVVLFMAGKKQQYHDVQTDTRGGNRLETVVASGGRVSLDEVLDYCSKQGLCSVLLDLRGGGGVSDGLMEILKEGLVVKKLVQKVIVEVLPFWANGGEALRSGFLTEVRDRLMVTNLSTKTVGRSVLIEGYL